MGAWAVLIVLIGLLQSFDNAMDISALVCLKTIFLSESF
jgi:hypothetical protein